MNLSNEHYRKLLDSVMQLMIEKGIKSLTMDTVARSLGMSKRTLYTIFESKQEMVQKILRYQHSEHIKLWREAFETSANTMEALLKIFMIHRNIMTHVSPAFFRDMDNALQEVKFTYRNGEDERHRIFLDIFKRGVDEGVFRSDVNYPVVSKTYKVQLESLKRMEEVFPPGLTLVEVYDSIIIGMLRSIATPAGMRLLDALTDSTGGLSPLHADSINK